MKLRTFLAILVVALPAVRARAIDFTPRVADSIDDGVPMRRMYFTDGARRIFYRPPVTWSRSGDERAAMFIPKDSDRAFVKIENAPVGQAGIPFNDAGLATLRKIAFTLVPPDAREPGESWEAVNPVVLQGWTSFEIGFDYLQSGKTFCRSVLFINLDSRRQIYFIVDAAPAEFPALYKTACRTLSTWWQPGS
jgi:hypothetical protein